jgi:hypothetical protein
MDQSTREDERIPDAPGTRGARVILWIAWAIAGSPLIIMAFRADDYLQGLFFGSVLTLAVAAFVAFVSLLVRSSRGAALLIGLALFGWAIILASLPVVIERIIP